MEFKVHQKFLIIAAAACVVVGAGAFAGGAAYGRSGAVSTAGRPGQRDAAFMRGDGTGLGASAMGYARDGAPAGTRPNSRFMGGSVVGEVLKMDAESLTVKLPDGGTRLVFLSDKTQVVKTETASAADLAPGTTVRVMGGSNPDGSVTAQNIQIVPAGQAQPMPQPPVDTLVK